MAGKEPFKGNEYFSEKFKGLNLSGQAFEAKEFEACTFNECDFSDAILSECQFLDCEFIKCNLSVVKIEYSQFSGVIFTECKLIGIDWCKAAWSELATSSPVKFYQCILNDCSFFGLSIPGVIIEGCKAHDVDFREGDFSKANFIGTDFSNSLFNKTNLTSTDFTEATDYHIDVYLNEIKRARFSSFEALNLLSSLGIELVD